MSVLVTGGTGFLGRALIIKLLAAGKSVRATSRTDTNRFADPNLHWMTFDLADFDRWSELLDGISVVYHFAWSTVPATADTNPAGDIADNVVGSVRLLDAIRRKGIRLVFASSGGTVYGPAEAVPIVETQPLRPIGAYGMSKLTVENYIGMYARAQDLDAVILRFGNPFGPGQRSRDAFGAVFHFCKMAIERNPITIFGDGSAVRDYLYIDDAVTAMLAASHSTTEALTFNIGSGQGRSLNDIIAMIERVLGRTVERKYVAARRFDVATSVLDISRAREQLGWAPVVPFEQGVAATLAYLKGGSR